MTKKLPILLAVIALSGCSSPAKDAERAYRTITKAGGTYAEACVAAKQAAAAWAAEGDGENYKRWSDYADIDCYIASSCRTGSGRCNIDANK